MDKMARKQSHHYLLPRNLKDREQLINALANDIPIDNMIIPYYLQSKTS